MPFLSTALQPSLLPSETFGNINPDNFFSHTQFGDSAIVRNPLGIGSTLISPDLLSNGGQGGLSSTHDLYGNSKPNCSQANPAILDPSVKSGHVFDFQPTFIQPLPILIGPTNTTTNVPAASSVAVATSALFSPNVSAESATTKTPVAFAATTSTDTFNKVTSSADSRSEPALCLSSVSAISIPTDTTLTYEPSSVSATMEEPLSATIGLGTTPFTVNARNQSVNPQSNGNKDHDGNFGTAISGCSQSLGSPLPAFSAPPPSSSSSSSTNPSQSPAILSPQPTPLPSNRNVPAVNTCHSLSKHSAIDGRQCETPANRGPIESSGTTSNTPTLSTIAATAGGVAITSQDASLGADSHMSPQPAHMFCMISHKGNFFTIQGNCFELLGYTSSELLTMKVQEILHPDDVAAFKCFLEALLRAKQPCCSYRFVRKDNSIARLKLAMCCNLLPVQQDISSSPSSPTSSLLPSFEENQGNDILGQSHQATGRSEPSGISAIQSLQEMYASALSNYSRSACSVNLDEYAKASDGAAKPARLPTFLIVATLDELQRQQHPQSSASSSPEQPLYQIVQSAASLGLQNLGVGTAPVLSASVVAKSTIRSGGSSNSDQITKILQKPKKRRGDRASKERDDSGGEPCPKPATPGADVLDGPGKDSMAKPRPTIGRSSLLGLRGTGESRMEEGPRWSQDVM
ncbi:hypothetical protein EV182_001328 [Spiromyces aspiralis]|uniref:Uncharacterized protein n=1 Tax=Spiromyces aspiralis TaxID=68401 RepID=A0ACC1HGT6_9FUNG|nr:hypothetical protein EV182_001328 [Spiromyces aspiralis]